MSNDIKKILITGSNGCIGTRLTEILLDKGYDVTGIDIKENQWNKRVNNVTKIIDIRDMQKLKAEIKDKYDLIIHLAANPYVFNSVKEPRLAYDNFVLLFNTLELARMNKITRFMFSSSREVYGNSTKEILSEEDSYVKNCESPYTATKIGGEALVHAYSRCYEMNHVILRFSNIYGMYDESNRLIPTFIRNAKKGEDLFVFGKDKLLDFTYIDDLISGMVSCIERYDAVYNNTFNLSGGQPTPIMKIAELINNHYKKKSDVILQGPRTGEVIRYVADLTKASQFLNFSPSTDIEEGLKKSIDWYEEFGNFESSFDPESRL
ncbi:MAG: NAD-dependent epimerase/dehydratase family protein [Candidatus Woesearchaeota archaeon]